MIKPCKMLRISLFTCLVAITAVFSGAATAQDVFPDKSRIISAGGSITEIIFQLNQQHRLVARDTTSNYPQIVQKLPDVGYMRRLSPEGVLSVNPDLIIAIEGSGPPETIELLAEADIPFITIPNVYSREGIVAKINAVATVLGVAEKGAQLADELGAALKEAEDKANAVQDKKSIMFILTIRGGRYLVSGTNTAADGIIAMAGGINAVTEFEGFKPLTDEAMSAAAPDIILLMERTGQHQITNEDLANHPAIMITPAGQSKRFLRMDGMFMLGFGPRTARAITELNRLIYPDES